MSRNLLRRIEQKTIFPNWFFIKKIKEMICIYIKIKSILMRLGVILKHCVTLVKIHLK